MKIVFTLTLALIALLFVTGVGRSQDVPPRIELTSYWWRWTQVGAEPCTGGLSPYNYLDEVSYAPTNITRTGHFLRDCSGNATWTETWSGLGMPGEGDYWQDYWPPAYDVVIDPFDQEMFHHIGCVTTYWDGGAGGYYTDEVCESATVRYVTGRQTPSKVRLHRLGYGATDRDTWNEIPYTSITARAGHLIQMVAFSKRGQMTHRWTQLHRSAVTIHGNLLCTPVPPPWS